jgi:hypothetical protein
MIVGLVWGLEVPATPIPRLALGAHIQLTGQGVMYLVAGLVVAHLGLGAERFSRRILISGPWLTWPMAPTEMANAWWGTRNMFPIAARQAGASGAAPWQESTVMTAHLVGAVGKPTPVFTYQASHSFPATWTDPGPGPGSVPSGMTIAPRRST